MTGKEAIEKIKAVLGFESQKATFKNAKLSDGNIISYEGDLAVGTIVMLVDDSGSMLPLPIGDYVLEDGTTFSVVNETGAIDNIIVAAPPEENKVDGSKNVESNVTAPAASNAQPKRIIKSEVEEHVFKIEMENEIIEIDFSSIVRIINEKSEKLSEENIALKKQIESNFNFSKQVAEIVTAISDEPISSPTESAVVTRKDQRNEIKEAFKKLTK
jgi:hypothetical protein